MHPFVTGREHRRRSGTADSSSREFDICWAPPWDPAICRRKLLDVQRTREKQRALRRSLSGGNPPRSMSGGYDGRNLDAVIDELSPLRRSQHLASPSTRITSRPSPGTESLPFNRQGIPQTLSNSQGVQISPPSSVGTSLSYQAYAQQMLPGSLGSANVNDGRIMNNLPHPLYAGPASLSDYNAVAVDQRLALSSMMLNGSYVADGSMGHVLQGPQSFSAIHGEGMHQFPGEVDFGYALQRPGVFPGMDLSGASNIPPPPVVGGAYSPHQIQMPPNHQRSRSFTHMSSGSGPLPHRRFSDRMGSYGHREMPVSPGNEGQTQYMLSQAMNSATSIKEDSTDFVLGGSMESSSFPTRSSAGSSTASLLSQQMRSVGENRDSYHERMEDSNRHVAISSQPPAYLGAVPAAAHLSAAFAPGVPGSAPGTVYAPGMPYVPNGLMPASADSAGYYYKTYITPNGAVMSAPVNMDMQSAAAAMQMHSYGSSYGSYSDQYGPPNSLHHQLHPPANLSQPSFEEAERSGSIYRPHVPPPPHYNYQGGMSM